MIINIVTGDPRPIFKQIVDAFRIKIAMGEIAEGTKLPSVRGLAMQLMINTNTVAKAYTELTSLGLVEAQQGRGLFVAPKRQLFSDEERQRRLNEAIDSFVTEIVDLGYSNSEIVTHLNKKLASLITHDVEHASKTEQESDLNSDSQVKENP